MCSFFTQRIMGSDHGDLADIVRGGGLGFTGSADQWKLANSSGLISCHETSSPSSFDDLLEDFGNPFANMKDPLLHHELGVVQVGGLGFNRPPDSGGEQSSRHQDKGYVDDHMKKLRPVPTNIFSRMLQISPNTSHARTSPSAAIPPASSSISTPNAFRPETMEATKGSNTMDQDGAGQVQIPTPRNPGIKRRKSQAKKVVCIPAPAAATSRPTGEVVPSDLWAWRKYGQKPIKGSPYPRGYYRCSSSKGCSARKQVERSRTDPNMLVITYTSEHNHPWPTQRNALAGSTRSQPSKANSSNFKTTSAKHSCGADVKEEKETQNNESNAKSVVPSDHSKMSVKDEVNLGEDEMKPNCLEMGNQDHFDQLFHSTYMPADLSLQGSDHQTHDDFFADLDELDQNPFRLISSNNHGFPINQISSQSAKEGKGKDSKASIDPFMDIYDWPSTG